MRTAGKRRYPRTLSGSIIHRLKMAAAFFVLISMDFRVEIRVMDGWAVFLSSVLCCGWGGGGRLGRVSGRQKVNVMNNKPPYMVWNHWVLRHPQAWAKTPPIMGARSGPNNGPWWLIN